MSSKIWMHRIGRIAQFGALVALPCSIWSAEIRHSERDTIYIFFGSIVVFIIGHALARFAR